MRISRRTLAPSTSAALIALVALATSAAAATDRAECLRSRSAELADLAACGHKGSIQYCLSHLLPSESHLCSARALEKCFVNAGCTADEAGIEAAWTVKRCDELAESDDMGDLRRRQKGGKPTPAQQADNANTTPADSAPTPKGGKNNPTPVDTPAQTAAPTAADTNNPPATDTPQQTAAAAASTDSVEVVTVSVSRSDVSSFHSTSTPLVCFTTTTISTTTCPIQSTGPRSGKETLSCFSTLVSFPTCAAGLLCKSDSQGNPVCMRIDNTFSTAGIIISLIFAVAITAAVAATCFFCCRERRVQKRLHKAAEAAEIAKAAALDKKRPSVGVRSVSAQSVASDAQPLMQPNPSVVYSEQDPFSDHNRMR